MKVPANTDYKSLMSKALVELRELRTRLEESERGRSEPIAVIGLGCRYPGGVDSPQAFWQLLGGGVDGISEVPADRWDIDAYYDPDPQRPGKMSCRYGGFLQGIDGFDASFFGITPRELVGMDPQQRLLLEVAWEALEHAGQAPEALFKTPAGVFTGISSFDYAAAQLICTDIHQISAYLGTGIALSAGNGRLSYALGLTGPSMAVDTACSSSLVAAHLACQSLRNRECDMALACGVNVMLLPELSINFSRARMLAPDGRCKTFDAAADGYVRGEGCGVVVLRRLSDALAGGDRILALIRGSAVNQDGPSGGLTVPSGPSQEEVIRQALEVAGVSAGEVGYIEAHGTGTSLGDPIEVGALGKVFGQREKGGPLRIGSVKTNIGHLEAAAGIAGLIKVVLSLHHGRIPAHLHFSQPNPHIDWDRLPFEIPIQEQAWPAGKPRIAGISAFGFTGTNAHVVLAQAPERVKPARGAERARHVLALSAKSEAALKALAGRYADYLSAPDFQEAVADVCFTANAGRSHFERRLALIGATAGEIAAGCRAYGQGRAHEGLITGELSGAPKIAFVFNGEGAYPGMGRALFDTAPAFHAAIGHCDELLQDIIKRSLVEALYADGRGVPDDPALGRAALIAVQYALCELWQCWGIAPALVMGFGAGEIAAALAAGMLTLEQALGLAAGVEAAPVMADPHIGMISCATGTLMTAAPARPEAWARQIPAPAHREAAMETLQQQDCTVWLGMGPWAQPGDAFEALLPSLVQGRDEWRQMLESLGALYAQGAAVDWQGFDRDYGRAKVAAPTYPFQRQRYWIEEKAKVPGSAPGPDPARPVHPLLGQRLATAHSDVIFAARIGKDTPTFLNDHRIHGQAVFPATGYVEMALAAGAQLLGVDALAIEDFAIQRPLILPETGQVAVQTILRPAADGAYGFEIFSQADADQWRTHATGRIARDGTQDLPAEPLTALRTRCDQTQPVDGFYQRFAQKGIVYGPGFRGIEQLFANAGANESLGCMRLPEQSVEGAIGTMLHPVLLDNGFQILSAALDSATAEETLVPIGFERLRVRARCTGRIWVLARGHLGPETGRQADTASLRLMDEHGVVLASLDGLIMRGMTHQALLERVAGNGRVVPLYTVNWRSAPQPVQAGRATPGGRWLGRLLILADKQGLGERMAQALGAAGAETALVYHGQPYGCRGRDRYRVDPLSPQDFRQLLAQVFEGRGCEGVLHLWSLDSGAKTDLAAIEQGKTLGCAGALHLVQALGQAAQQPRLWLVTRGAQAAGQTAQAVAAHQGPLWGFQRVLALEQPELRSVCLDLDPAADPQEVRHLSAELGRPADGEDRIAWRKGERLAPRLMRRGPIALQPEAACRRMTLRAYGIIENLTLAPMQPRSPGKGEVQIAVAATGLNFRDVLRALGMLKAYEPQLQNASDARFGFECSGTITALGDGVAGLGVGDAVIAALTEEGSLGSHVTVPVSRVVEKPAGMRHEEGATIPLAFLTACYALAHLAKVQPGERVLIHAAAGGVGLAAIQIAKRAGARIYATAGTGKWDYVKSLGVEAVLNSRTPDYAQQIPALTQGRGVDVVLNSLTGEHIPKSLEILAPDGRFVEIGKIGIWDADQVRQQRPDVQYDSFDLGDVAQKDPGLLHTMLVGLMDGFSGGQLKPLRHTVFSLEEGASAFRHMAQARHIGKVVLRANAAAAGVRIRSDAAYLITGGLGALGCLMAEHLKQKGAGTIVLCGRNPAGPAVAAGIERLRDDGTQVVVMRGDVSREADVRRMLARIKTALPDLKGIIHAAGVLDDGIIRDQTWERFARVMAPKVDGAWHLHRHTRDLALDFFILFSSTASGLGSPGQCNYAAANAFLDTFSQAVRHGGGRATTINWGPWDHIGMAATHKEAAARFSRLGIRPIRPAEGVDLLDRILASDGVQAYAADIDWPAYARQTGPRSSGPQTAGFLTELLKEDAGAAGTVIEAATIQRRIARVTGAERIAVLQSAVIDAARNVMGYEGAGQIKNDQPLAEQGLDSLMSVELRNLLGEGLDIALPVSLLFDYPSVNELCRYLVEVLRLDPAAAPGDAAADDTGEEALSYIDEMAPDELEAMIQKEIQ